MSVQFTHSCPTCGRRARIRTDLIGATVACQHCNAEFIARPDDRHDAALQRLQFQRARWLPAQNWEHLLTQPVEQVRADLGIAAPIDYEHLRTQFAPA